MEYNGNDVDNSIVGASNNIADTYLQLNKAEQAASKMEQMLDSIEEKMQQLIDLQSEIDSKIETTNNVIDSNTVAEFKKLDTELQQLQEDVEQLQTKND